MAKILTYMAYPNMSQKHRNNQQNNIHTRFFSLQPTHFCSHFPCEMPSSSSSKWHRVFIQLLVTLVGFALFSPRAMAGPGPPGPTSFHRRPLPPPAVAFASPQGRRLFAEALGQGKAKGPRKTRNDGEKRGGKDEGGGGG